MSRKTELIRNLMRQDSFDINDLVRWSNYLLPHFVSDQHRYKVSDKVTVRIVRYYLNRDLISKPVDYKGRNALFGPNHVIQILAIKSMQAQYIPLKKIAQIMDSIKEQELLAWLVEDESTVRSLSPSSTKIGSGARSAIGNIAPAEMSNTISRNKTWKSVPVHEKVELYLSRDFNLYDHESESADILLKIMQALTGSAQQSGTRDHTGSNKPFVCRPARAVKDTTRAVIALVTEGGLVPHGNPDGLPPASSKKYFRYSLEGLTDLVAGQFESIDRGWDNTHVNNDPDRLLPLDIMRELEGQHQFDRLHQFFFSTTGAGTSVKNARLIGRGIAKEIKAQGVSAVLLTAT